MSNANNFVKLFGGVVKFREQASLKAQPNRSGRSSYYAYVGTDAKGKPVRRSLGQDEDKAYAILREINERLAKGKLAEAKNAFEVATDLEVKAAMRKLEHRGATIQQATDFFLKHHRPTAGHLTVEQARDTWLGSLKRTNRTKKYIESSEKTYLNPFVKKYGQKRVIDITQDDAEEFIYETKKGVSLSTQGYFINRLRVFFNGLAELGYSSKEINPFQKLKLPDAARDPNRLSERDRVLPIVDVIILLEFLQKESEWSVLIHQALVLFCGIRNAEAHKMTWDNIDLTNRLVEVTAKIAKKNRRRVVEIPDNALPWLTLCHQKLNAVWPKRTEKAAEQKLKRIRHKLRKQLGEKSESHAGCKLQFHQNYARVSFASYSFALFGTQKTIEMMGHLDGGALLSSRYKEVVKKVDAEKYFNLVPEAVMELRRLKAKQMDNEAYEEARMASGPSVEPIRDENGTWHPVTEDFIEAEFGEGDAGN